MVTSNQSLLIMSCSIGLLPLTQKAIYVSVTPETVGQALTVNKVSLRICKYHTKSFTYQVNRALMDDTHRKIYI